MPPRKTSPTRPSALPTPPQRPLLQAPMVVPLLPGGPVAVPVAVATQQVFQGVGLHLKEDGRAVGSGYCTDCQQRRVAYSCFQFQSGFRCRREMCKICATEMIDPGWTHLHVCKDHAHMHRRRRGSALLPPSSPPYVRVEWVPPVTLPARLGQLAYDLERACPEPQNGPDASDMLRATWADSTLRLQQAYNLPQRLQWSIVASLGQWRAWETAQLVADTWGIGTPEMGILPAVSVDPESDRHNRETWAPMLQNHLGEEGKPIPADLLPSALTLPNLLLRLRDSGHPAAILRQFNNARVRKDPQETYHYGKYLESIRILPTAPF